MGDAVRDLSALRRAVLFEGPAATRRESRFWLLLVLAAVIASAGVVADSEATVIGAMLVAPLRIPIMGTTVAIVLGDRTNLRWSLGLVLAGAATTIAVGFGLGLLVPFDLTGQTVGQVATWSHHSLVDLAAALAVGAVGAIALVRDDIGDALPGVAIALSLVPPLTVVGLAAESGASSDAVGALLLFGTNVAAILATGVVVLRIYRIRPEAPTRHGDRPFNYLQAYGAIVVLLLLVLVLLGRASWTLALEQRTESAVATAVADWADDRGWELLDVVTRQDRIVARVAGPPPFSDLAGLRGALAEVDVDPATVDLVFVPSVTVAETG